MPSSKGPALAGTVPTKVKKVPGPEADNRQAAPSKPKEYKKKVIITQGLDNLWSCKILTSDEKYPLVGPDLRLINRTIQLKQRELIRDFQMNRRELERLEKRAESEIKESGQEEEVLKEDLPPGPRPTDGGGAPINRTPEEAKYYEKKDLARAS